MLTATLFPVAECVPAARLSPTGHPTLAAVELHREGEGGAVILRGLDAEAMVLDYEDADTLAAEWRDTLMHYAAWAR